MRAFLGAGAAEIIAASRTPLDRHRAARSRPCSRRDRRVFGRCSCAKHLPSGSISWSIARAPMPTVASSCRRASMVRARRWRSTISVCLRWFEPSLRRCKRRRQGVIVNMLSMVSLVNIPRMATYSASKAAAFSLTQAIRAELMPYGIHVCTMLPSATDTPMSAHLTVFRSSSRPQSRTRYRRHPRRHRRCARRPDPRDVYQRCAPTRNPSSGRWRPSLATRADAT